MVADPAATALTGTETLVEVAEKNAVAATLATLELLELRFTVKPPEGAAVERLSVRTPVVLAVSEALLEKLKTPEGVGVEPPEPTTT